MSRIFEALRQSELERGVAPSVGVLPPQSGATELLPAEPTHGELEQAKVVAAACMPSQRIVCFSDEASLGAEKFRLLATRLKYLQEHRPLKTLVLSSASVQEGKSTVAANIAVTLARRFKQRVLLLDGDLRQPSIQGLLGLSALPGFGDWFTSNRPLSDFLHRLGEFPLWVMTAGSVPEQPLDMLQSPRTAQLMTQCSALFDWVIVDTPPVLPLADTTLWMRFADGLLLVVREGATEKKHLGKAVEAVEASKILGIVLNDAAEAHSTLYQRYSNSKFLKT